MGMKPLQAARLEAVEHGAQLDRRTRLGMMATCMFLCCIVTMQDVAVTSAMRHCNGVATICCNTCAQHFSVEMPHHFSTPMMQHFSAEMPQLSRNISALRRCCISALKCRIFSAQSCCSDSTLKGCGISALSCCIGLAPTKRNSRNGAALERKNAAAFDRRNVATLQC
jgi:hypothetical protein